MWGRAEPAAQWGSMALPSPALTLTADARAMSGPAPIIGTKSSDIGALLLRRAKLIDLANRARILRQRKRASLIEATLRQVTMEVLRHETRRQG